MSRGCETLFLFKIGGSGGVKGSINIDSRPKVKFSGSGSAKCSISKDINLSYPYKIINGENFPVLGHEESSLINSFIFSSKSKLNAILTNEKALSLNFSGNSVLKLFPFIDKDLSLKFGSISESKVTMDKFYGKFIDTTGYNKLYPKIDYDVSNFKSVNAESDAIFEAINEGVFYGDYHENGKFTDILFNDNEYIITDDRKAHAVFTLEKPLATIRDSYLIFRAESNSAFRIYDIQLENKFGNTVCIYPDIIVSGDNNFTTYASRASINYAGLNTYESEYESIVDPRDIRPIINSDENFPVLGFDEGGFFVESGVLNTDHNLDVLGFESPIVILENDLKIKFKTSIINSDNYSSFNEFFDGDFDVTDYGNRYLKISSLEISNFIDGGIREEDVIPFYTEVQSKGFRQNSCFSPLYNSGQRYYFDISKTNCAQSFKEGSYAQSFSQEFYLKHGCEKEDFWFVAEDVYLKAYISGTGTINIVGYTNDGLLNYQVAPFVSGVKTITQSRIQSVPLVLNIDNKARPIFNDFYLDIVKSSGIELSKIEFCVSHAPSNAIKLETLGGDIIKTCSRNDGKFIVSTMQSGDYPVNMGDNYSRVSLIENIPQMYGSGDTLRTNYSRRWVGNPGNVRKSPFDVSSFDFDFEFEQLNTPFLLGHYVMDGISGNMLLPKYGEPIQIVGNRQILRNLGLRTKNKSVLSNSVHTYDSIDWDENEDYKVSDSYNGTLYPISGFVNGYEYNGSGLGNITNGDIILPQEFTNVAPSGFSLYLKFSLGEFDLENPDLDPPRDIIFCSTEDNSLQDFILYIDKVDKQIKFYHDDGIITISSGVPFDYEKQFPYRLLVSYDNDKIKLSGVYDNNESNFLELDASGISIPSTRKFIVRTGNIYLHELGFSQNNLVFGDPNNSGIEESAIRFMEGTSTHWFNGSIDNYKLPSFINTDTEDWDLGEFKFAHFDNAAFDIMKTRPTLEHISFDLMGSGSPYNNHLSYNSQIENDFLRFNFNNCNDNVYSIPVRISKDILDGYIFNNKSIVAETIMDYSQEGEIIWADGKIGTKLIVTLFSNNLGVGESGIINKKEFYLDPYSSWEKLECTFDPENYWGYNKPSIFNQEFGNRITKDVLDEMFIQYDVEIPNSNYFRSKINIHSVNVDAKCILLNSSDFTTSLNIYTSGEYIEYGIFDIHTSCSKEIVGDMLVHSYTYPPAEDNVNLYIDASEKQALSILAIHHLSGSGIKYDDQLSLYLNAQYRVETNLNLFTFYDYDFIPQDMYLMLYTYSSENNDIRSKFNMVSYSSIESNVKNIDYINLVTTGFIPRDSIYEDGIITLFTKAPNTPSDVISLYLEGRENLNPSINDSLNLNTVTHSLVYNGRYGKTVFYWNSLDLGRGVESFDEERLSVPSTNEIRDTEGVCYGDCGCTEDYLTTHNINWLGENCYDGGVARPFKFNKFVDNPHYPEGFYYGVRKYTGLIPNSRYNINISVTTGSTDPIELPREFEEWEYGTLGDIDYTPNIITNSGDMKCVKSLNDKLFVSRPNATVNGMANAGLISVYKRTELIGSGDKAEFEFLENITLPSGMIDDFYYQLPGRIISGYGEIPVRKWNIGQNGREFGYSIDVAKTKDKEVLVVGAPKSNWNRTFDEIETSDVNIALLVFTDEYKDFSYDASVLENLNILLKYFGENPTKVNIKPIIYHPTGITELSDFDTFGIVRKGIPRNRYNATNGQSITEETLEKIKEGFFEAFPYNSGERNNNIPFLLMAYVDNSRSMGRYTVAPAIDRFFSFYKDYSFLSGVVDIYDNPKEGYVFEKLLPNDVGENHRDITKDFLGEILSIDNLLSVGATNLLTNIGPQYANLENVEFNIPPESGGRVYIFENEFDSWSLIQEVSLDTSPYSMFGHTVSISEDTNTIAIGSPHATANCIILKRSNDAKDLVYNAIGTWLKDRDRPEYDLYKDILELSGTLVAGKEIYKILNDKDRFYIRNDGRKINEFDIVISDGIDGVNGEFHEIPSSGAGNPRLGFSAAINKDGSIVAFGAPTDSLGLYSNADFYFKNDGYYDPENPNLELIPEGTWNSYVNAGSIRIYDQARKTYPTSNDIFEYGRFGNLSRSLMFKSYSEEGYEQNSSAISKNENYKESLFNEFKIPDETPVLFIVTPEVDATNEEVIGEIKRWMSLGDRKLVLVGDDPVWEYNGAFRKSNDIINKILDKLDSKMRLVPAKSRKEALLDNNSYNEEIPLNVIESFKPEGSRSTDIKHNVPLNAFGVADIKFYSKNTNFSPYSEYTLENNIKKSKCSEYNTGCKLPIANYGDLRAEWTERGFRYPYDENRKYVYWKRNLPFEYNSAGSPKLSDIDLAELDKSRNINMPGLQPTPLMVAAEFRERKVIIPGTPPSSSQYPIYEEVCIPKNTLTYNFADDPIEDESKYIIWSFDKNNYLDLDYDYNLVPTEDFTPLFNPEVFYDRDGILQGKSISFEGKTKTAGEFSILDEYSNLVAKQSIGGSLVYLIASVKMEEDAMINEEDQNISFYDNLVRLNSVYNSNIAQIGGWTGASSFNSFVAKSVLKKILISRGHNVVENHSTILDDNRNVAWIANTPNLPNNTEAQNILSWLNSGNKKLIITYDNTQEKALNAYNLCKILGLNINPWKLPDSKMAKNNKAINIVELNTGDEILGYVERDRVNKLSVELDFIPIQIEDGLYVVRQKAPVDFLYSSSSQDPDTVKMRTGVCRVRFPVLAGSGYEITYRWYSDFENEKQPLEIYMSNVSTIPSNVNDLDIKNTISVSNYDSNDNEQGVASASYKEILNSPTINNIYESSIDVQVSEDYLDIFITGNKKDPIDSPFEDPHTCKLLDITIKPLPINQYLSSKAECYQKIVGYGVNHVSGTPDEVVTLPPKLYAIFNDDSSICDCSTGFIENGPVVIAEELESFSSFSSGADRSSIILISDSTLVNGRNPKQISSSIESGVPRIDIDNSNARINNFLNSLLKNNSNLYPNIEYQPHTRIVSNELTGGVFKPNVDMSLYVTEYDYKEEFIIPHTYPEEDREEALDRIRDEFEENVSEIGLSPKIVVGGTKDIPMSGVGKLFHSLMIGQGKDFLDKEFLFSNYYGELFGYSLTINDNKVFVGSPYNGWRNNVIDIDASGGGGAVFVIEKDSVSGWLISDKLKPDTVFPGDKFGYSLSSDSDLIVVSAPTHDYGVYVKYNKGDFVRKEFTAQFDIGVRKIKDIGDDLEVTETFGENFPVLGFDESGSGTLESIDKEDNIGAVYTYQNKVIDFNNRVKELTLVEKIANYGTENFGLYLDLYRNNRSDSDYTLPILENSGVYIYDGMIRRQPTSLVSPNARFNAFVFGSYNKFSVPNYESWEYDDFDFFSQDFSVSTEIKNTIGITLNNLDGLNSVNFKASGDVYSDQYGQIFLEVSGVDISKLGFVQQRPYVSSILGKIASTEELSDSINFYMDASAPIIDDSINLYTMAPDIGNVYTSMDLHIDSNIISTHSGNINMIVDGIQKYEMVTSLPMYVDCIGQIPEVLSLRIRGK
jgi:hypothetical protein